MDAHKKYARARDQLYHLKVAFRELEERLGKGHVTAELRGTVDILRSVIDQACEAFEAGDVMAVQIERYTPMALPGFEEAFEEMKRAAKYGEP